MTPPTAEQTIALTAEARTWPTIAAVAERSGISTRTIRRAVVSGELPYLRLGVTRISPDAFAAWIATRQER